jgi:D-arginine dehydrogenase
MNRDTRERPVEAQFEFAIIGGGIAGASLAYQLAKTGRTIALFEKEATPGYHSTGRSAAFYAPVYGNHTVRCLTKLSGAFYHSPPSEFCEHPLLSPRGALFIADQNNEPQLKDLYNSLKGLSDEVRLLGRDFALEKVPVFKEGSVTACVWDPESHEIDVAALHQGYLKQAKSLGAELFVGSEIDAIEDIQGNDGGWIVKAQGNEFVVETIINAAGAWCDKVAKLAGIEGVGLQPKKRSVCIVPVSTEYQIKEWPLVVDVNEAFYFKPEGDSLLISPADETPVEPMDAFTEQVDLATAIDRVSKVINVPLETVSREWAGLRSFVKDKSPVIGFEPGHKKFFWFAGQGGYGIQMADGAARLASSLLLSKPLPAELNKMNFELSAVTVERFR